VLSDLPSSKTGSVFLQIPMRSHGGARAKPAFYWAARGDWSNLEPDSKGVIFSNCDHLKLYIGDRIIEADPDRTTIPGLAHPPFQVELRRLPWTDLRIEGYVNGNKVIEKQYSSKGIDQEFVLLPDDTTLEWSFVLLMNTARCIATPLRLLFSISRTSRYHW